MLKSRAHRQMIHTGGCLFHLLTLPRLAGKIYGFLYFCTLPQNLDDISRMLRIGRGTASTGTRDLLRFGAIREVWTQGDRRTHFEAIVDLEHLLACGYEHSVKPRLASAAKRIDSMTDQLDEELRQGSLTLEEVELFRSRFQTLSNLNRAFESVSPFAAHVTGAP